MLSSSHSTSPDAALSRVKATTACREDWIYRQRQKMPRKTAGRERDSLITAEISLIARFNSLQGAQKIPCSDA
jgi:hypothetical protein